MPVDRGPNLCLGWTDKSQSVEQLAPSRTVRWQRSRGQKAKVWAVAFSRSRIWLSRSREWLPSAGSRFGAQPLSPRSAMAVVGAKRGMKQSRSHARPALVCHARNADLQAPESPFAPARAASGLEARSRQLPSAANRPALARSAGARGPLLGRLFQSGRRAAWCAGRGLEFADLGPYPSRRSDQPGARARGVGAGYYRQQAARPRERELDLGRRSAADEAEGRRL